MPSDELADDPETYWEQERVNERDEWDQHLRHVEEDERDRLTRDAGETKGRETV